jgi:hypothetical protein
MRRSTGVFSFRFEDRTFIAAPPEAGFAFFQEMATNYRRWHPDHLGLEWRQRSGIEVSSVIWFRERIAGKVLEKEVRITEVVPDRCFAFAPTGGLLRAFLPRMSFAFRPEPGGFVFAAEIHLRGVGPLGRRFNRRKFAAVEQHMAKEGQNLKELLESEPPGSNHAP